MGVADFKNREAVLGDASCMSSIGLATNGPTRWNVTDLPEGLKERARREASLSRRG